MIKALGMLGGAAFASFGSYTLWKKYDDQMEGNDPFSMHSCTEQNKHWISGMHKPYLPNQIQRELLEKHFSEFGHLVPSSQEAIDKQCHLNTTVQIRHLSECPIKDTSQLGSGGVVVVGGAPALISTAFEKGVTYIYEGSKAPIAYGSALHLEWDGVSEAPSTSQPIHFMIDQLRRLILPEFLATAQKTGQFSWRSLDWISWLKTPSQWPSGMRIAFAFQRFNQAGPHPEVIQKVVDRSKKSERFYKLLDGELNNRLLSTQEGSIYVARTNEEAGALLDMREALIKEEREFPLLSNEQLMKEFGYLPGGLVFGKKIHDRTLSPHFMSLLSDRICQNGGKVFNGRVLAVYTDDPENGGIVEYRQDNNIHYIPFKKLVMSLGSSAILGVDNKPLFDIVSARGISMLALARLPLETKLPPVVVCGSTNHVTKLAGPILHEGENLFLLRMTCGACITPKSDSMDYDGNAAIGLKMAASNVLKGKIEVITTYGCNRQVSQYGQIHWLTVPKTLKANSIGLTPRGTDEDVGTCLPNRPTGIFIQYGAGGGGLTQAPSSE